MPDEIKEAAPAPAPAPKPKPKPEPLKVKLRLTCAGSCNYDGLVLRRNDVIEIEVSQAEEFLRSGLFERA